jgi:glutathione S-transferase
MPTHRNGGGNMARYRLIIGTKDWSSWSLRAWLALKACGAPFEEIVIRLRQTGHEGTRAQILQYSPSGKVPVLQIEDDGARYTVFDSLAICETLAELHPDAALWPDDPSTRAFARSISAAMHSGFADLRAALSMDFARRLATPELSETVKDQIAEITGYWQAALDGNGGKDFLFGRLSIADCMYAPVVSRFRTYGIALAPALAAYSDRVLAYPPMREWEVAALAEVTAGLA